MDKRLTFLVLLAVCHSEAFKTSGQPTDVESKKRVLDLRSYPGDECYRKCIAGKTRTCYFKFMMEHYQAMGVACGKCAQGVMQDCFHPQCITVDGIERGVTSINRQIPGPPIHVCHGDRVVVDVVNMMSGTSTTLHWHGLHMRNTQMYDGVPYVTQCPISFGQTFRYQFTASEPGTHFYHSHAGHHKINGHFGSLVVRKGDSEVHSSLYDYDLKEHTILVTDWIHNIAEMFVPGLPSREPGLSPESVLINGKGIFVQNEVPTKTPIEVIKVIPGNRYRFRYINSASYACPVQLQIQGHQLEIIATDSFDVKPVTVDTLISTGGERYDFVVDAKEKSGTYCIRVTLLGNCASNRIEQYGILAYSDTHDIKPEEYEAYGSLAEKCRNSVTIKETSYMNHPNTTCYDPSDDNHCSADLSALNVDMSLLNATVDKKFYIAYNNYVVTPADMFEADRYEPFLNPARSLMVQSGLNNISFALPTFSLLTQPEQLHDDLFCDQDHLPKHCDSRAFCHCIHRVTVLLDSIVEFVLIDVNRIINGMSHPFHMHGYGLTVTGMSQAKEELITVESYREFERKGQLLKAPEWQIPVRKDTISIPSAGYVTFRFRANNPGLWLLHCHIDHHFASGMTLLMQVGDPNDFPKAPEQFPKCNDFVPDVYENLSVKDL